MYYGLEDLGVIEEGEDGGERMWILRRKRKGEMEKKKREDKI